MSRSLCQASLDPRFVGDPVDTLTGAVTEQTLDFRLIGPLEFWWVRHYSSAYSNRRFALGFGHSHDFERHLRFDVDGFVYFGPLGREVGFTSLKSDGDECRRNGFSLRRVSPLRYEIRAHGEPAIDFLFESPSEPARPYRIFQGRHEVRFEYGAGRRLERIIDSAARRIRVVEEADGRLVSLTLEDELGRPGALLVGYRYDERGNLTSTTNAEGHSFRFEYDAAHRMVRRTGRMGFQFYFDYDAHGRCTKSAGDGRMEEVSLEYTIPGRLTKVTRADGGTWQYLFDETGGLTRVIDPLGGAELFVRDDAGRVTLEVDPNGNATRVVYDLAGAPVARVSPFGHVSSLPEDPNAPDPGAHRVAGNAAEYELGRLLPIAEITLPTSREVALLPVPISARALIVTRSDDPADSNRTTEFQAKPLGPIWWPRPKQGRHFTELGKLVDQTDQFGRIRHWSYNASGNLQRHTDFDGRQWSYDYGAWHLRLAVRDPMGATVRYSYLPSGSLSSCVDAIGTRTEYGYDLKDQIVEVRRHGVVRDKYSRDAAGTLTAKRAGDDRTLLLLEIGPGNRPIKRVLASGDEHTFQYDESGRYMTAATKKDMVTFAYDSLGHCRTDKRNGQGVEHLFQGWQSLLRSVLFDRFLVRYNRHPGGIYNIIDPGGKKHVFRILPNGIVERHLSNGSSEFVQYEAQGRCLLKSAQRVAGQLWTRRYHWSGEGELLRVQDNLTGEVRHEYDTAHRLCRRILGHDRTEDFEHDQASNLLRKPGLKSVELGAGNRIVTSNGLTFEYNDRHHVALRQTLNGPVRYSYDSRDQLIGVETPQGHWEAEYDALGRRTRKIWAGQSTEYYWNSDQLIAELHSDGRLRLYVYADSLALTPFLFLEYESFAAPLESCRRYFVFGDQVGTPCLVEDELGKEVWRARIDPFGSAVIGSGATIEFNLRFPGHYCDSELGLHYNRFRYYDPDLGRYLQSDPWGLAGGLNLYAYPANPLLDVDVRGLGDENDPKSQCRQEDEEGLPRSPQAPEEEETPRPRLGQQEGQDLVNDIHGALPEGSIAARNTTTTLTETEDGTIIITNSASTSSDQRQVVAEMQEPGGPLEGRRVLVPDDPHDPGGGYIPSPDRDLPPQGPNNTPTGRENHGEQRGIQAANHYDEHGDQNGQGHGPADSQWSRSEAGHQGLACPHCAEAQRQNNVHNPTGVDPDP